MSVWPLFKHEDEMMAAETTLNSAEDEVHLCQYYCNPYYTKSQQVQVHPSRDKGS